MSPFCLFLLLTNLQVIPSSEELEQFQKALDNARGDLKCIRVMTGHEYDYLTDDRYKRSATPLEDLLASFDTAKNSDLPELTNEIEIGDAWYNNFRSKECKSGNCVKRTFNYPQKKKKRKRNRKHKGFKMPHKFLSDDNISKSDIDENEDEYPNNLDKNKHKNDPEYDEYDNMDNIGGKSNEKSKKLGQSTSDGIKSKSNMKFEEKYHQDKYDSKYIDKSYRKEHEQLPNINEMQEMNPDFSIGNTGQNFQSNSQGEHIDLKDQLEKTQNDLSHEANYKLSKIEQEAMEKTNRKNRQGPLKHPEFQIPLLMHQKEFSTSNVVSVNRHNNQKRNINAEDEIKLKLSNRFIERGLGPSLPSDALQSDLPRNEYRNSRIYKEFDSDKQNGFLIASPQYVGKEDDLYKEVRENKRDTLEHANKKSTARKLMTVNGYDSIYPNENDFTVNIKEKKTNIKPLSYYGSDLQNYNGERNKIGFSEELPKDDDRLSVDFSEDFMKSSNIIRCADSSQYVKIGSKANNQTCGNSLNSSTIITINKDLTTLSPEGNTTESSKIIPDSENNNKSKSNLDLNLKPNPNSNSNQHQMNMKLDLTFNVTVPNNTKKYGMEFGTTKKKRKHFEERDGRKLLMINKRGIIFPPLPSWFTEDGNLASRSIDPHMEDSDMDYLMSGKLSAQLVNAVFHLVQGNEDFRKHILPGLKNRTMKAGIGCNELSTLKTEENSDQISRSEQMLREVMETINAIIEQQVRSRTCIPLCPALKKFYDLILLSRIENDKKARSTKNQRATERAHYHNKATKREVGNTDEPKIRRKYSIVKKLLNQYSYLPYEDQEKVKDAKDMLKAHLAYLEEFERAKIRKRRELTQNIFQPIKVENREIDPIDMSPEFVKLIKTAEMMKKSALSIDEPDFAFRLEDDYF